MLKIVHSLVHGNCEAMSSVGDGEAHAIITSPPYADAKDYGDPRAQFKPDSTSEWFRPKIAEFVRILRPGGHLIMVCGPRLSGGWYHPWRERLSLDLHEAGMRQWELIAWHKKKFQPIRSRFGQVLELIQWHTKPGGEPYLDLDAFRQPYSERSLRNMKKDGLIKRFNRQRQEESKGMYSGETVEWAPHPKGAAARNHIEMISDGQKRAKFKHYAAYPIELVEPFVVGACPPRGLVCDPFSGTGTTGVACRMHDRKYIGYELVKKWHDIAVTRLQTVSYEKPRHKFSV